MNENRRVVLDAGPLGRIAHPRRNPEVAAWLDHLLTAGFTVILPEIADYEVRRELLLANLSRSVRRLDRLKQVITYAPLTTEVMLRAAELWASVRRQGQPTADVKALDGGCPLGGSFWPHRRRRSVASWPPTTCATGPGWWTPGSGTTSAEPSR